MFLYGDACADRAVPSKIQRSTEPTKSSDLARRSARRRANMNSCAVHCPLCNGSFGRGTRGAPAPLSAVNWPDLQYPVERFALILKVGFRA